MASSEEQRTGEHQRTAHVHRAASAVPRNIQRRTIVKGAAWSVPVIAATVAAPMAAASTKACPSMGLWWGDAASDRLRNLDSNNRWTSSSTGTAAVGLGNPVSGGYSAFAMSSPEAVVITVSALSYTYTLPYQVNWGTPPAGWVLSNSSSSGGAWTYTFTYTVSGTSGTVTSSAAPGTTIVPTAVARGTIVPSSIPIGTDTNAIGNYTATINVTYTPNFTTSAGCTSTNGNDGLPRARTYSVTRPLLSGQAWA